MTTARFPAPGVGSPNGGDEGGLAAALRAQVRQRLAAHAAAGPVTGAGRRELTARLVAEALDAHARAALADGRLPLDAAAEARLAQAVTDALVGLGRLQRLLKVPGAENIDCNGCDRVFMQYTDGRIEQVAPVADSDAELVALVRAYATDAAMAGDGEGEERRFDRAVPRLSLRLPDGSRLFAVMSVSKRPLVSIRRHPLKDFSLDDLVANGTMTPAIAAVLHAVVRARLNVVICGGANTGKTQTLRTLARAIPPAERLVTVEDAFELDLDADEAAHPNVAALQAREPNIEGAGAVDMAELVRWGLRMNPHRVIVGEARGHEVIPLLNAMSQGNDGSLATIHASSSRQAFTRLATYAAQAPERLSFEASAMLIGGAVDVVVQLAWSADGRRVVSSMREVTGADGREVVSNEVYAPGPDGRAVPATPIRAQTLDRLVAAGLDPRLLSGLGW
jgi:pilus assembly protein CpaF